MNLQEVLCDFEKHFRFKYYPKTLKRYARNVKKFYEFCPKYIIDINKKDVKNWVAYLSGNGMKPSTVKYYLQGLRLFYKFCLEEEIVSIDPTHKVVTPKVRQRILVFLEKHELFELKEVAKNNIRDRLIIDVLYNTGVRVSELLNILIEDINFEEHHIWIRKGKGLKERFVFFKPECGERIKDYLSSRKDSLPNLIVDVYGKRPIVTNSTIFRIIKHYAAMTSFKKRVSPHVLRATLATHLLENGAPLTLIAAILGHSDIEKTRIYAKFTRKARKNEYDTYY